MAQPLKKKEIKKFDIGEFKKKLSNAPVADKPMEWIIMPKAFQDALQHTLALLLQIGLGEVQHRAEYHQQHGGDDDHVDTDKYEFQTFDHACSTSRR